MTNRRQQAMPVVMFNFAGMQSAAQKVLINENTFNTMKITRFLMVIVMLFTGRVTAEACTAAVISGRLPPTGGR